MNFVRDQSGNMQFIFLHNGENNKHLGILKSELCLSGIMFDNKKELHN